MTSGRSDLVDVQLVVNHETDKAWRVSPWGGPGEPCWLPKSQAQHNGERSFTMPRWLAEEKGLV